MADSSSKSGGRVVLVVNAGSEAGSRVARRLLGQGYRVAVTDRNMINLVRILHGHGASRVFAVAADLNDPWQVERLLVRVAERFGRIDSFVSADESYGATWFRQDLPLPEAA